MIVQSDKDDSELNDDGIVLGTGGDTFQTRILTAKGSISGKEVKDLIGNFVSAIFHVCTQLYETITNRGQLQQIKGRSMVANESLLIIKGLVELTIMFDKI